MLERQFADFLTAQMRQKVEVLERETDHSAVKDLKDYITQLDGIFAAILSNEDEPQPKRGRKKTQPEEQM